jgi:hypothetical protein
MNSPVKTFRITKEVQQKLTTLRHFVKPTRPNAWRASEGDVLREVIEFLYAQRVAPKNEPTPKGKAR